MEEKEAAYALLEELGVSEEDLQFIECHGFLSRLELGRYCLRMRENGRSNEMLREEMAGLVAFYHREGTKPLFTALPASSFTEPERRFLWKPSLPEGEFTVLMAPGGTGKTFFVCAVAAAISRGLPLPGQTEGRSPARVLLISAEDEGGTLRTRLEACGADLEKVMLMDCRASQGLSLYEHFEDFREAVTTYQPKLVAVDPWHAFLGPAADMNRANTVRPVFQQLANLCKELGCAMLLVAHVNKRLQTENINNAAMGSADLVNASRSVLYLTRDPEDERCRVAVHSKANYASEGRSLRLRIENGGDCFAGFTDVTKEDVELANRSHHSLKELLRARDESSSASEGLAEVLCALCNPFAPLRMTYLELEARQGPMIYGGRQPKRALDAVKPLLEERGVFLRTDVQITRGGKRSRGFLLQSIAEQPEQTPLPGVAAESGGIQGIPGIHGSCAS